MDKPISVGDLVVLVKPTPCCGDERNVGRFFTVLSLTKKPGFPWCNHCAAERQTLSVQIADKGWVELYRLKRIPPLDELEGEKREEEIAA